jgi:transposase
MTTRKRYSSGFKAKVFLEALREERTTTGLARKSGLARKYEIQPTGWKRGAIRNMAPAFDVAATAPALVS